MKSGESSWQTWRLVGALALLVAAVIAQGESGLASFRVVDEAGKPVAGVRVRARLPLEVAYSDLDRKSFDGKSDANGEVVIEGLPVGRPVIAEINAPKMIGAQSVVTIARRKAGVDATSPEPVIMLTPGRSVRVRVTAVDGRPIGGAEIRLLPLLESRLDPRGHVDRDATSGSTRVVLADTSGVAVIDKLPAGPITCEVRAEGFDSQLDVIEPQASPATVDFRLARDPSPPPATMPWLGSIGTALETAKKGTLPVLVAMTMDGERANDSLPVFHYRDREVTRVARRFPMLLSSAFGNGGVHAPGVDHAQQNGLCARYGSVDCHAHQAIERWARARFIDPNEPFEVPRHIILGPEGEVLIHRVYYLAERDLLRLLVRGLRLVNPRIAADLARARLAPIVTDLQAADGTCRARGMDALALLVNSGDEHAVALLADLVPAKVPAPDRLMIVNRIFVDAIEFTTSAISGLLQDPDASVRRRLLQRIAASSKASELLEPALSALRDGDAGVRAAALEALGVEARDGLLVVGAADAGRRWRIFEELLRAEAADHLSGLTEALRSGDDEGRNRLLRAIAAKVATDGGAARVLLTRAGDADPGAVYALRLASRSSLPATAVRDVVLRQAGSPCELVAQEAMRILGARESGVDAEVLERGLRHPSKAVNVEAALGLARRGRSDVRSLLQREARDPEFAEAIRAVLGN